MSTSDMTPADALAPDLTLRDMNPAAASADAIYPALEHDFLHALARTDDQPGASHAALAQLADRLIGARLFTLMSVDSGTRQARRVFSSHPEVYPVSGTKPVKDNAWTRCVLDEQRTFVANDAAAIAEVFDDHALITSLGCGSIVNVPVVIAGQVIGTINCLHQAGHFTNELVARAGRLALPGAACFLLVEKSSG